MDRDEALDRLKGLAQRLHIAPGDIKVRPVAGSQVAMRLAFRYQGVEIARECSSQPDKEKNFICLVLWLGDLVRNLERRLETLEEAFYSEGARLLPADTAAYGDTAKNLYEGSKSIDESLQLIGRSVERLGLTHDDIRVTWDAARNEARLRLRLRSGAIVDKISTQQQSAQHNLAALALWLQTRAKNVERGIEQDLDRLFAANLLPAST